MFRTLVMPRVRSLRLWLAAIVVVALSASAATLAQGSPSTPPPPPPDYPEWDVVVAAHRGLSPGYPENTLAAFRNSVAAGVPVIETDLRSTADGHIVLLHDPTLDATTDCEGPVAEKTLAEVKTCDAGSYVDPSFSDERVPTFQELLDVVNDTGVKVILDIKDVDPEQVVRIVEENDAVLDMIVGPRTVEQLKMFHRFNPNLRTLGFIPGPIRALTSDEREDVIEQIKQFSRNGVNIIRLWPVWMFQDRDSPKCQKDYAKRLKQYQKGKIDHPGSRSCLVQMVHDRGLPVWTTADTLFADINPAAPREDLDELVRLRVNGILTNLTDLLNEVLADAHN